MLSKIAKEKLKASQALQGRLADAFARSVYSIPRWIEVNSPMLETHTALQIIRDETGLTDEEILEPVTAK